MDKIERIKAELKRRISRCEKKHPPLMSDKDFTDEENEIYCEECAYREILSFIDSLQDEPIVKDSKVSEEIDQNFTKSYDDDLEKAAMDFAERNYESDSYEKRALEKGFVNGANWQKERDHDACQSCENSRDVIFHNGMKYAIEQMKKEAVEGVVCKQRDSSRATWIEFIPDSLPSFEDCESVKCIILKDDDLQP